MTQPPHLHRARSNKRTAKSLLKMAQTNSNNARKVTVTLKTPPWTKKAKEAGK